MNRARIVCLLLATCLLWCGCAVKNDSPPTASVAAKTPEKEAVIESWQESYAETAINSLYSDPGMKAKSISLFHNYDELPLLVMSYKYIGDDADWREFYRAWKYEKDGALLVYEGNDYVIGVRAATGNPVIFSQYNENELKFYDRYVEHYSDKTTALLEFEYGYDGDDTVYRSLLDGSTWTSEDDPYGERISGIFVQQIERLPLVYDYEVLESAYDDFDPTEKIRDFLGVSGWSPPVPVDAPQWVSDYISLLHNHLFFSYYPDQSVNLVEEGLSAGDGENRWTGVKLLEPPEPGGAPILGGDFVATYYSPGDTQVIPLKNRMLFISDGPDEGYELYKDTQGRYIIRSWSYTYSVWDLIGEYDLEPLFRSAYSYLEDTQYAYLDDEYMEFGPRTYDNTELAITWVEEKVKDKFAELGYTELLDWPQTEIHLPEVATWNEIEPLLIEAFCNYARDIGQM